jgi:hypothetical protein
MPSNHGKQKQKEKQKKKREIARKKASRPQQGLTTPSTAALLKMAARLPFGPCFVSAGWEDTTEQTPALVTVVATRRSPQGVLIPAIALVDRTCLGVKDGFVAQPITELELHGWLAPMREMHGDMLPVEPKVIQSIVFHAIDFAHRLGFEPHKDFPEPIFGPRPETLLDTPLAGVDKPIYVAGPDDRAQAIVAQLHRVLGAGNYEVTMPSSPFTLLRQGDDPELDAALDDDIDIEDVDDADDAP